MSHAKMYDLRGVSPFFLEPKAKSHEYIRRRVVCQLQTSQHGLPKRFKPFTAGPSSRARDS